MRLLQMDLPQGGGPQSSDHQGMEASWIPSGARKQEELYAEHLVMWDHQVSNPDILLLFHL